MCSGTNATNQCVDQKIIKEDDDVLVRDPRNLLKVIKRLWKNKASVVFWNIDRTFKIMLRKNNDAPIDDPEDPHVYFDICLLDENEDEMIDLFSLDNEGYYDEDDERQRIFVLESLCLPIDDEEDERLEACMHRINGVYATTICACESYFIKDNAPMCCFCLLTSNHLDLQRHFCCVCQSDGVRKHMLQQSCCNQYLHRGCLHIWHTKSDNFQCPLCRKTV